MINYSQYARIHHLYHDKALSISKIAKELDLNEKTVSMRLKQKRFEARKSTGRSSKLDLYKPQIKLWLGKHDYSAQQVFQMLREAGFSGGYTIVCDYVKMVRPRPLKAYLKLSFAPGECAQVDWGSFGAVSVGNTRRRLSFFVMVMSYSRMMYVEFTLSEKMEHFLHCHQNAFTYFGGIPAKVMIDNLKTGVLEHKKGEPAVFNSRYLDFAKHYDFEPVACNVRSPQEKGRVESGVGYVKKNLLRGLKMSDFKVLPALAKRWLDEVANVRIHSETGQMPSKLWEKEQPQLGGLTINDYDIGSVRRLRASSTFRITLDTNHYSVPAQYASQYLDVKIFPDKLLVYHQNQLIAEHIRSYGRKIDFENPDHVKALLAQRHKARIQKQIQRFLQLGEHSEQFYHEMQNRRINPNHHISKILALCEVYSCQMVAQAISDANELAAYHSDYIANILEQRKRITQEPGPLHLTHKTDMLELESPKVNLSIYNKGGSHE